MIPELLLAKARKKGTDIDYLAWLCTMPSATLGLYGGSHNGEGRNEAAHVRRVSHGSGVAEKPEYSAVPLTHDEHALQHQKGESVFASPKFWEEQACIYLANWINGVKPPVVVEDEPQKRFTIRHAGQFVALWLWAKKYFIGNNKKVLIVTIEELSRKRSLNQNAGMWVAVYGSLVGFYKENPARFGYDMAQAILKQGIDEDSVHMIHKLLHGVNSTAKLSTFEHARYFDMVANYMMQQHGFEVKMPVRPDGQDGWNNL